MLPRALSAKARYFLAVWARLGRTPKAYRSHAVQTCGRFAKMAFVTLVAPEHLWLNRLERTARGATGRLKEKR